MVYNLSLYRKKKEERLAAKAVAEVVMASSSPGVVIELKSRVTQWFSTKRDLLKMSA